MNEPDINSIIAGLTDEDFARLNDMAQQLFGGSARPQGEPGSEQQSTPPPQHDRGSDSRSSSSASQSYPPPPPEQNPFGGIDPQMMAKIMKILPLLQGRGDDERTRLICALKPLLSEPRQKRADEAMQLMRLLDVLPMLGNSGLL